MAVLHGFSGGKLSHTSLAKNKDHARSIALQWPDCSVFGYGRKLYTPSQVYAGLTSSTNPAELGFKFSISSGWYA